MLRTIFLLFYMLVILSMKGVDGHNGTISITIKISEDVEEKKEEYKFTNNQIQENENEVNGKITISDKTIIIPIKCYTTSISVKLSINLVDFIFTFNQNWLWRKNESSINQPLEEDIIPCFGNPETIYTFTIPSFIPCFQGSEEVYTVHTNEKLNLTNLFNQKLRKSKNNSINNPILYLYESIHYGTLLDENDKVMVMYPYNLNVKNIYYQASSVSRKEEENIHFYILTKEENSFLMKCLLKINTVNEEEKEDNDNDKRNVSSNLKCNTHTCDTELSLDQILQYIKMNFSTINKEIQIIHSSDYSIEILNLDYNNGNISNLTSIDFTDCLNILYDNDKSSHPFYLIKVDKIRKNTYINDLFYFGMTSEGNELNLSLCQNIRVTIDYPINVNSSLNLTKASELKKKSIDVFDPENSFFNDYCLSFSENGKDVVINDRRSYYYQNASFCPTNCNYKEVNFSSLKAKCVCKVKTDFDPNQTIVVNSFKDFAKYSSKMLTFYVLKCTKSFIIKDNWTFLVYILFIFIQIFLLFYAIMIGVPNIIFAINNAHKNDIQNKCEENFHGEEKVQKVTTKHKKDIVFCIDNKSTNKMIETKKTNFNTYNLSSNFSRGKENEPSQIFKSDRTNNDFLNNSESLTKIKKQRKKRFPKDYEKMSYGTAFYDDKRSLSQVIFDHFSTSFSFFQIVYRESEYSLLSIQSLQYCFALILDFYTNIVFFKENEISKIFLGEKIKFMFKLYKTFISLLIAVGISSVLKKISSIDNLILNFKNSGKKVDQIRKLKIKIIITYLLYGFIIIMFLSFISLHVGLFCSLYQNSQIEVFKDFLYSFLESIIINLGLGLMISLLRYYGVKYDSYCLFTISQILLFFTFL